MHSTLCKAIGAALILNVTVLGPRAKAEESIRVTKRATEVLEKQNVALGDIISEAEMESAGSATAVDVLQATHKAQAGDRGMSRRPVDLNGVMVDDLVSVTCMTDDAGSKSVYIGIRDGRIVKVDDELRVIGEGRNPWRAQPDRTSAQKGRQSMHADSPQRAVTAPPGQEIDYRYVTPNAWPPKPGDPLYAMYMDAIRHGARGDARPGAMEGQENSPRRAGRKEGIGSPPTPYDDRGISGVYVIGRPAFASDVLGATAHDSSMEPVGEFGDLVLDLSDGRLLYAVLEQSEFLGMGTKRTAVPFALLDTINRDRVIIRASESEISKRGGFSNTQWPEVVDEDWRLSDGTSVSAPESVQIWCKATNLLNHECLAEDGQPLGRVRDLVIDTRYNFVGYVVVDREDVDGLVALPIHVVTKNNQGSFVARLSQNRVRDLETFQDVREIDWQNRGVSRRVPGETNHLPRMQDDRDDAE